MFAPGSDIIDRLLYHVYQKSISELLNKFLNVPVLDYEGPVTQEMTQKQLWVVEQLIAKLGPDSDEEDNLNGASILSDLLEVKEFYQIMSKKQNV